MRWPPSLAHDNGMFVVFSNGVGVDDDEFPHRQRHDPRPPCGASPGTPRCPADGSSAAPNPGCPVREGGGATPTRKGSARAGVQSRPTGKIPRRRTERRSAPSSVRRQPAGSTRTACPTRRWCRRMVRTSTTFSWPVPAQMRCSSTFSAITRATSRCIRHSRNTSALTGRRFWRCGAKTIRSLCRLAPRRSSGTILARPSASSTPATSPWKLMPARSQKASAIS